ncbi:MAG: ABC-type transport auxiliary lipoprotein family protein [Pseudomonas sp.]|uniref:PqiC family protein n=1 Tax=Pseudomonas sp. TaxID=306 RepID=UPI0030F1E93F
MISLRIPSLLLLTSLLSMVGCVAQPPVTLYQLDSGNPKMPVANKGVAVLLGPVSIADYLQQQTLLQRQQDGSLTPATQARWAGTLGADIDQVLLRQLASRLDTQRLVMAPGAAGFIPDVQVQLTISRMDSGPLQPAVLDAQWRLLDRRGQLRDSRLIHIEEPHQGGSADQIRAQSVILQRLAEQLAVAIKPLSEQPIAEESRKPAAAPTPAKTPEPPQIPKAAPVRQQTEVFRF